MLRHLEVSDKTGMLDNWFKLHFSIMFSTNSIELKNLGFPQLGQPSDPMFNSEAYFKLTFKYLKNQSGSAHCMYLMNFSKFEVP